MSLKNDRFNGIITRGVGGLYGVRIADENGDFTNDEVLCRARGVLRRAEITPTVGDDVIIEPVTEVDIAEARSAVGSAKKKQKGEAEVGFVIDEVLERRSLMLRPSCANLDYLFAVIPAASPEPDLLTVDKLTVIAENYGIESVVVINKSDLDPEKAKEIAQIYSSAGYKTFLVSASLGDGIEELRYFISELSKNGMEKRHISGAFAGASGAGKSTIMTKLFPTLNLTTGSVSRKTERGRHTTRHVELYPVQLFGETFWLADTPGFSMLDFTRFDFFPYDELAMSFREFGDCIGECRYTKCTHLKEEGCAVIKKINDGKISPSRHESYKRIYDEQRSVPEWKRR